MWWGRAVVGGIAILLFIATEIFFPVKEDDPVAKKGKHFWAILIFIFSVVLGLPIELSVEIQNTLNDHSSRSFTVGRFQDLDAAYDKNFGGNVQPVLNGWANTTLSYLQDSWNRGMMPLPQEKAADEIAKVYKDARASIVATNVGSTKLYFGDQTYVDNNCRV